MDWDKCEEYAWDISIVFLLIHEFGFMGAIHSFLGAFVLAIIIRYIVERGRTKKWKISN